MPLRVLVLPLLAYPQSADTLPNPGPVSVLGATGRLIPLRHQARQCSWSSVGVLNQPLFQEVDMHPEKMSNIEAGYLFEELIRKIRVPSIDPNQGFGRAASASSRDDHLTEDST